MIAMCRPYGARLIALARTHRFRGGLRYFVPTGLNGKEASFISRK